MGRRSILWVHSRAVLTEAIAHSSHIRVANDQRVKYSRTVAIRAWPR